MQSARYSPGHGQPHPAPIELASMIHAAAASAVPEGTAFSFGISFNDIASVLRVMPDGTTPIDFIYAYNNIVPIQRDSLNSPITYHSDRDSFQLVLPSIPQAAGTTTSSAQGAGETSATPSVSAQQTRSPTTKAVTHSSTSHTSAIATSAAMKNFAEASSSLAPTSVVPTDLKSAASTF
ncbi:hypothetical protein HDU81_001849, partial [Chytriomyces hyalinus]